MIYVTNCEGMPLVHQELKTQKLGSLSFIYWKKMRQPYFTSTLSIGVGHAPWLSARKENFRGQKTIGQCLTLEHNQSECRILIGQLAWLKTRYTCASGLVRFERSENDDSRT